MEVTRAIDRNRKTCRELGICPGDGELTLVNKSHQTTLEDTRTVYFGRDGQYYHDL